MSDAIDEFIDQEVAKKTERLQDELRPCLRSKIDSGEKLNLSCACQALWDLKSLGKSQQQAAEFISQHLAPLISDKAGKLVDEVYSVNFQLEECNFCNQADDSPYNEYQRQVELRNKFGNPYYLDEKKKTITINESFWAGLHFAENIEIFEPTEKCFYRYDEKTGLYSPVSPDVIKQEISSKILEVSREDKQPALEKKRQDSTLGNIASQLRGIAERRDCFVKNGKPYVHLGNGVISPGDNGSFSFGGFSPQYYSRNQSPIKYDPSARCERFLNELLHRGVDTDDALIIQKYVGMILMGDNLIQRLLILDGLAGRGKTTLALVIQFLTGLVNVSQLRTSLLNERFELFRYLKKTLLCGVDVPGDFLSQRGAQVIKGLVGGDLMDAEQKSGNDNFPLLGKFCVVITSNSRLHVKLDGDIGAWERRLLIVRFEMPPPEKKIPNFAEILIKEEGSGILNWALEGLVKLLEDVKSTGDIALAEKQQGRVTALLAESDSLKHFLVDRVETSDHDLTSNEIIEQYARYCPARGWVAMPITIIERELPKLMLALFHTTRVNSLERAGKKGIRGYRRVSFKLNTWEE